MAWSEAEFSYQGRLIAADGTPITNATSVIFSLWQGGTADTADSGTEVYRELAAIDPDSTGIFNHVVGTGSPLNASSLEEADFDTEQVIFLQVAVDLESNVLLPRTQILAVPRATQAVHAQSAVSAEVAAGAITANVALSATQANFADTATNATNAGSADFADDAGLLGGQSSAFHLNRANHTGNLPLNALPQERGSIWLPAWSFAPTLVQSTNTSVFGAGLGPFPILLFPEPSNTAAMTSVQLPQDMVAGRIRFRLSFAPLAAVNAGQNEIDFILLYPGVSHSFTGVVSAQNQVAQAAVTTSPSVTFQPGQTVPLRIVRFSTTNDDTYVGDIVIFGVTVEYPRQPLAF